MANFDFETNEVANFDFERRRMNVEEDQRLILTDEVANGQIGR